MQNIIISKKTKAIIYSIAFVFVFAFGAYVRPGIDIAIDLSTALFTNDKATYVAPPSEYETLVLALWKSEKHQAVCKANAAASVSVTLARKYLEEAERQAVLSTYDLPASEAVEKTANYGKR